MTGCDGIAVIGMAGRFPGAENVGQFWQNLLAGVESITSFDENELRAAGIDERALRDPNYVMAAPIIDHVDTFDASYFGISPREAEILDPQHRSFLEICGTALADAAYDPDRFDGRIGVYTGAKENSYLNDNLKANASVMRAVGELSAHIANQTDYLATGIAYRLNLVGPAITMVTACSTSLVATHLACRALRSGECDMALAGGVEIVLPIAHGYTYSEGGILSPDATVRPFDANARGTVFGSGVGAVLLKRLDDAIADGDTIHAVIRGSAVNNDGADKGAFSGPSERGQRAVIEAAIADAAVDPDTVGYIEAHGTGTLVGDPIEVAALRAAYDGSKGFDGEPGWRAVASVKGNVGHLGAAAGICGLIKAVLCVREGVLPPSINLTELNPRIDLEHSSLAVTTERTEWAGATTSPRRAGVSSFGIGGTNAHLIVEQAVTKAAAAPPPHSHHVLVLSAASTAALDAATTQLGEHLAATTDSADDDLADVAYSLAVGRPALSERRVVVAADRDDAVAQLRGEASQPHSRTVPARSAASVALLLPGQGAQYPGMARGLYDAEPVARDELDRCAALLRESHDIDLLGLLFGDDADALSRTEVTQPTLFAVEWAVSRLLAECGVEPAAMLGHSVGEYVAATIAGVFSLPDALRLVADRGALMGRLPSGSMLAVTLTEEMLLPMLPDELDLAAVNAPGVCVVSGAEDDVLRFRDELAIQGVGARLLHTSHAFHSRMMDPIVAEFRARVAEVERHTPTLPYLSNVSGTWITDAEATDPGYWATHLRQCVRFSDALRRLLDDGRYVFLEAGPGRTLSGLVTAHTDPSAGPEATPAAIPTLRHPHEDADDVAMLLTAVGKAWAAGAPVDWDRHADAPRRRRVSLPAYPYQRRRFWVDPDHLDDEPTDATDDAGPFYVPVWRETATPACVPNDLVADDTAWLVLAPAGAAWARHVATTLREAGADVVLATPGNDAADGTNADVTFRVTEPADYAALVGAVTEHDPERVRVVHGLCVGAGPGDELAAARHWLDHGFHSGLAVLRELARTLHGVAAELVMVTSDMQDVVGDGAIEPAKASVLGLVKVAGKEFENLTSRSIDVSVPEPATDSAASAIATALLSELGVAQPEELVARRGRKRWAMSYAGAEFTEPTGLPELLRPGGRYLITGGLGGLGLILAKELATLAGARLILTGRTGLPDRAEWQDILDSSDGSADDRRTSRIRAVRDIEAAGGEVIVRAADVTDEDDLRRVRDIANEAWGGVDGVFHLAAVVGGAMLETRGHAAAEAVLAPKVMGTYLLDAVFAPELFVGYSTIAVVHGDFGLGDYIGGNAVLDAFAQQRWAHGRRTLSINFSPWTEAGMAYEVQGPAMLTDIVTGSSATPVAHPLLTGRREDDDVTRFDIELDVGCWVLAEHTLYGMPTMPGTGIAELIRAAWTDVTGEQRVEITDLQLSRPLAASDGVRAQVELRPDGPGGYQAVVIGGPQRDEYARARLRPAAEPTSQRHDLAALTALATEDTTPPFVSDRDSLVFGPRWDNITTRRSSESGDLDVVTIELADDFHDDLADYTLHPALFDSATALGMRLPGDGRYLPFGYAAIRVHAPLPARCHALVSPQPLRGDGLVQADIVIVDDDGVERVAVDGFTMVNIDREGVGAALPDAPADEQQAEHTPGNPATTIRNGDQLGGVSTADGTAALRAMLRPSTGPQVVFCPEGIVERRRRTSRITRAAVLEQATSSAQQTSGSRQVDTPYVAPETDTESTVATIWQRTLWLDKVGIDDDFFELGGNSLVAVQLVAELSKAFGTDVVVAQLFELRTIRKLAAAIEESLVAEISSMTEEEAAAKLRQLEGAG